MANSTLTLRPGDIIIVNNRDGNFLSAAIRFFTGSNWSHTAIGWFPIGWSGRYAQTIFEANLTTGVTNWERTFNNEKADLRIYRWTRPMDAIRVCWELFDKYNGNTYGAFQLLWFIWRWLVEKINLPNRWARKNFFPGLEICTEILFVGFMLYKDPIVDAEIAKCNRDQNTVHPGDILSIAEGLRKQGSLELIYCREMQK